MKSLAAKMCEVMKRVRYIQKTGRNSFHKYNFLEESELVERIGEAMAEVGIAYFPEVVGVQHIPDTKDKGILTTITVSATFACSDTGETHTVQWAGVGHDALDKGIYKAMTGANKYLLMKTFLISTGDDPEEDSKPAQQQAPPQRQQRTPTPKSAAAPQQAEEISESFKRLSGAWHGIVAEAFEGDKEAVDAVREAIKTKAGCVSWRDMAESDIQDMITRWGDMPVAGRRDYLTDRYLGG